jgi:hypothetical protein
LFYGRQPLATQSAHYGSQKFNALVDYIQFELGRLSGRELIISLSLLFTATTDVLVSLADISLTWCSALCMADKTQIVNGV